MARDRELLARKRAIEGQLLQLPGVHAVALGGKLVAGRPTGGIAIQVYVVRKRLEREIDPGQRIPSEVGGVPTDVVQMAIPRLAADMKRYDPLRGGIAIDATGNPASSGAGTLGCFARILDSDGKPTEVVVGLSNHHVLGVAEGSTVGHPTYYNCGECCSSVIGKVLGSPVDTLDQAEPGLPSPPRPGDPRLPPMQPPGPGYTNSVLQVDAGLIRLDPCVKWYADIEGIGAVAGTHDLTLQEVKNFQYPIRKRGRTTGLTFGRVIGIYASGWHASEGENQVTHAYVDQIEIAGPYDLSNFAEGGDSGSVVVNDHREVVALLWGAEPDDNQPGSGAVATPIGAVTKALNIQIATAPSEGIPETVSPCGDSYPSLVAAGRGVPVPTMPTQDVPGALAQSPLLVRAGGDAVRWLSGVDEVRSLISANRRVAAVWQRNQGPQLASRILTGEPLVGEMGGRPVQECVDRILHVLARYGSAALRAQIADLRRILAIPG